MTQRKPRWWLLVAILAVATIVTIAARSRTDEAATQMMVTLGLGMVTALLVLIWWLLLSALPWKTRLAGLAALALAIGLFFALFRYESLGGDYVPRFAFRFSDSAEERAAKYFESQTGGQLTDAGAGDRLEVTASDWPGFRGPSRDGRALDEVVRTDWQAKPPVALWRHQVGPAWSSFAVAGGLAFTQEQRGEDEVVVAYQAETGKEVWVHANRVRHETFLGGIGPRATPMLHDSRLYTLGATGLLDCLDPLTGEVYWSRDVAADAGTLVPEFGFSGSPLVFDDFLVVAPGMNIPDGGDPEMYAGKPPGAVIAYQRTTGEVVWKATARPGGYAAPRLETIAGEPQILVYSSDGVAGHDPGSGEELWWFEWRNPFGNNAIQPIVTADGGVFISTETTGSALLDPRRNGDAWTVTPRWERPNLFKLRFNGGVLKDGHVYGLDGGILAALDLAAGERKWKRGRYKYGQILLLRDHLLVQAESGDVVLLDISPEGAEEIARFHAVDGRSWNHPVVNRGLLFVRSDEEAACYDLRL